MKEYNIRLPPHLTEGKIFVSCLTHYTGLSVSSGLILLTDAFITGTVKCFPVPHGLTIATSVDETFKLIHETAKSVLVFDLDAELSAWSVFAPKQTGILLTAGDVSMKTMDLIQAKNKLILDMPAIYIELYAPLSKVESTLLLTASVDGVLKQAFLGSGGVKDSLIISSVVEIVKSVLVLVYDGGIAIGTEPILSVIAKTTGAMSSLTISSEGDAILSHSLGQIPTEMILTSSVLGTSKRVSVDASGSVVMTQDDAETHKMDLLRADNQIMVSSWLKNLCYHFYMDLERGVVILENSDVPGTLMKVLYGIESGFTISSDAESSAKKLLAVENNVIFDSEFRIMANAFGKPEESNMVIKTDAVVDMKRYRLLSDLDDLTLADIDDMTLEALDYVWLT